MEVLVRNSGAEATGIIGKNALKQKRVVKMKPSSIYWNGLRTFEIVRNPGLSHKAACESCGYQVVRQDKGVSFSGCDSHRARSSKPLVASLGHHRATYDVKRRQLDSRR